MEIKNCDSKILYVMLEMFENVSDKIRIKKLL